MKREAPPAVPAVPPEKVQKITKAGLMVGAQYGDGVLLKSGKMVGHYNTSGASYGL
jgi:lipid-binding SYLF domain-containing protein